MPTSRLCATVTATTMGQLLARRDAVRGADMVELRLDGVRDLDVDGALAGRRLPVVVTCRPPWQGGRFDGAEETRLALLERAWHLGAEHVDLEDGAGAALMQRSRGERIVRSFHDFTGGVAEAADHVRRLLGSGAALAKVAVTATRLDELAGLAAIGRDAGGRAIVLAMGVAGMPSRVLAARFHAPWTYAGDAVAPGQLPLDRMRDELRVAAIGAATRVFGVVGRPIGHSLSPAMHNAALAAVGLDAVYLPLAAADFADFEAFARAFDVEGASVTAPFKLDALHASRIVDARTRAVGAVNTLRRGSGGWDGRNTDIDGVLAPFAPGSLSGRRVAVLGAGGAARSAVVALSEAGARVTVHARRPEAAARLAADLGVDTGRWPPDGAAWDVLVNTTPVGTAPAADTMPIALDGRLDGRIVYDLVYNPAETALCRRARVLGAETFGGLAMLAAQAEAQFTWWTGRTPPAGLMHRTAQSRLEAASIAPAPIHS